MFCPKFQDGYHDKSWFFVKDYAHYFFRLGFGNDYVSFFVRKYGMKQFKLGRKAFCFALQTMDAFDLLITGCNHFIVGKHSLSFNNVMFIINKFTHFVEQTSGSKTVYHSDAIPE